MADAVSAELYRNKVIFDFYLHSDCLTALAINLMVDKPITVLVMGTCFESKIIDNQMIPGYVFYDSFDCKNGLYTALGSHSYNHFIDKFTRRTRSQIQS
jgi:hypothetical protein